MSRSTAMLTDVCQVLGTSLLFALVPGDQASGRAFYLRYCTSGDIVRSTTTNLSSGIGYAFQGRTSVSGRPESLGATSCRVWRADFQISCWHRFGFLSFVSSLGRVLRSPCVRASCRASWRASQRAPWTASWRAS